MAGDSLTICEQEQLQVFARLARINSNFFVLYIDLIIVIRHYNAEIYMLYVTVVAQWSSQSQ